MFSVLNNANVYIMFFPRTPHCNHHMGTPFGIDLEQYGPNPPNIYPVNLNAQPIVICIPI